MGHAAACGHPADVTRQHPLRRAEAVLVQDRPFEQVGQCRQADMRVLADVHAMPWGIVGFEHVVEKHERPDAAALGRGQGAQDRLPFDRFGARADDQGKAHGVLQAKGESSCSITC
ncbi:hypothetical protein D3C84_729910 [compost metagenome]